MIRVLQGGVFRFGVRQSLFGIRLGLLESRFGFVLHLLERGFRIRLSGGQLLAQNFQLFGGGVFSGLQRGGRVLQGRFGVGLGGFKGGRNRGFFFRGGGNFGLGRFQLSLRFCGLRGQRFFFCGQGFDLLIQGCRIGGQFVNLRLQPVFFFRGLRLELVIIFLQGGFLPANHGDHHGGDQHHGTEDNRNGLFHGHSAPFPFCPTQSNKKSIRHNDHDSC